MRCMRYGFGKIEMISFIGIKNMLTLFSNYIRKYSKLKAGAFFLLITLCANAGDVNREVNYANELWLQYYTRINVSDKTLILADASSRWKNNFNNTPVLLLRTGIGYKYSNNISFAAGIATVVLYNSSTQNRIEYRGWEEISITNNFLRAAISNRIRIEQRYFSTIQENSLGRTYSYNNRIRYRLMATIPLNKKEITENSICLNLADESMINAGKEIVYNTFDSNRIIVGLTYYINNNLSVTANYLNQLIKKNVVNSFDQNNILWLSVTQNFLCKKKT